MSRLTKRIHKELQDAMHELAILRPKTVLVNKRIEMAYQEGVERGSAAAEAARVLADDRMSEILRIKVERDLERKERDHREGLLHQQIGYLLQTINNVAEQETVGWEPHEYALDSLERFHRRYHPSADLRGERS